MNISEEQRDQIFEAATEQQKFLYASSESGRQLRQIANKHNLTSPEQYKKYALLVGDVILGLHNRSELPTLLSQSLGINTEQAVQITGDLIDFLDQPVKSDLSKPADDISSDIAEAEAALNSIPQMRTMDQDMKQAQPAEEKIYSSTQEAILKEGSKTINDNTPRWGETR